MRRFFALILLAGVLLAGKVDVRIVTTASNPQQSQAYQAMQTLVYQYPQLLRYVPPPSDWSIGPAVTSPPNPNTFKGLLLVFDNQCSTGNVTRDKQLANAYVNNVIMPALKEGMRVALIVGPYSYIGQLVLYRLGVLIPTVPANESGKLVPVPACVNNIKPLEVMPTHPIYKNVVSLPGSCCMVPIVPDLVAPASLGISGHYCVFIRLSKISDEMIILSWKGIFRDISSNPNVQKLVVNVIKYLAGALPAEYPKTPYTVTKTVTTTTTVTTTLTNNITIIMSTTITSYITQTVTSVVTSWLTVTNNVTVTKAITTTLTKFINVTKTVLMTVTSPVTTTVTETLTKTINVTVTTTATLTKTLYRTIMKTVTQTVVKKETNAAMLGGAFVGGLIVGIVVIAILTGRGGKKSTKSPLEEW